MNKKNIGGLDEGEIESLEEAGVSLSMAVHSHEQPQIHGEAALGLGDPRPPCWWQ